MNPSKAVLPLLLLALLLSASPCAAAEDGQPRQMASGLSIGGGAHLYGAVFEVGQEVLGEDFSLCFDLFYSRSDYARGDDRTRSDLLGFDFLIKAHLYMGESMALYGGGGILLAFDYWRWRDRDSPALDYGYSAGGGLLLTAGLKIRLFGEFYVDVFAKAGFAVGLERGGTWKVEPAGYAGIKIGLWTPVMTE